MALLKTIIHVHTNYSSDSNTSPADLIATARRQNVDCVAITDHDEIAGALAVRELGGVQVIVGEEVSTADGHLIGLFLKEWVPPGLSAEETAEHIRAQGGLVLAPHPYTILCQDSLGAETVERLVPWLDAVEVCNAQDPLPWENTRARRFAERHGLTSYVGADTHLRGYLDACHQLLPAFDGPAEFLDSLRRAELFPGRFSLGYFAVMGGRHIWEHVLDRRVPGFGANAPGGLAASSDLSLSERRFQTDYD